MRKQTKILLISTISMMGLLYLADCNSSKEDNIPKNIISDTINQVQREPFSDLNQSSVYNMICIAEIEHPKVVLAQAILETNHFTSNVLKTNNNLFGFHNGIHYLKFKTIYESCQFYKEWQKQHYWQGDYYVFLDEYGYAKDSNYVEILKKIKINV